MSDVQSIVNTGPYNRRMQLLFRILGVGLPLIMLWNGVADLIYGYSPALNGLQYFGWPVWDVIRTAGGRSQNIVMLAQTAGWLYPVYALTYYLWWVGMRKAGFWAATFPILLMTYAVLMIGGTQHADWAYLSVLARAKAVAGSADSEFISRAGEYIVQYFLWGDLTTLLAFFTGSYWHAVTILRGKTLFPKWFVVFSPGGFLTLIMFAGVFFPAPVAGIILAPFGTWYMLIPTVAKTVWLWNRVE